jgi:tetratricopeptide (TPR) repeat protein
MAAFEALPLVVQREGLLLALYSAAAGRSDGEAADAAYERIERLSAGNAELALLQLDPLIRKGRYDDAYRLYDRIAELADDPAWTDLQRGLLHRLAGRHAESLALLERAKAGEPTLCLPHWELVDLALQADDHPRVALLLTEIERDTALEIGDLTLLEPYARFVKSEAYAEWLEKRGPGTP